MDKKTGIILGVIVAAFAALVGISIAQANTAEVDYDQYDLNAIIPADENSGNISETIMGNPDAPVLIFEYGDYQCTACAPTNPHIKKLIEEYDGKVAVVFRTYIMSYHQNGQAATAAALAAHQQGYWEEYKDTLFTKQNDWYYSEAAERQQQFEDYFMEVTDNTGDLEKFREDMGSNAVAKKIKFDNAISEKAGLDWTPTFYIDGELIDQRNIETDEFLDKMRKKIDAKLKEH